MPNASHRQGFLMLPPIIAFIGCMLVLYLLVFIVPGFETDFVEGDIHVPPLVQMIIDSSHAAGEHWLSFFSLSAVFTAIVCFLSIKTRDLKNLRLYVRLLALLPFLAGLLIVAGLMLGNWEVQQQVGARDDHSNQGLP
jgi:type II secretory pathway component PulF